MQLSRENTCNIRQIIGAFALGVRMFVHNLARYTFLGGESTRHDAGCMQS